MKKYRFNFSVLVYILSIVVLFLACAGVFFNVKTYFFPLNNNFEKVTAVIFTLLCFLLIAFIISLTLFSAYVFKNNKLYVRFGIIKINLGIKNVQLVKEYKTLKKLVLVFSDAKYTVIVIKPEKFESFIKDLKVLTPNALYETESEK